MKSLFAIPLLFLSLLSYAQIVDIPDPNFIAALIAHGVDTNNDGEIQVSEAELVESLSVIDSNISDLTGISSFINLIYLGLYNNQLTALDLTGLNNLEDLNCSNNQLSDLNITGLNNLLSLDCANNELTSLDITNSPLLISLNCHNNQLTTLNVSGLSNLIVLTCYNNVLTTLNVNNLNNLNQFECYNNQLTSLSIVNSPSLFSFDCSNNQLTSLVINNSPLLSSLDCSNNQITSLDISDSNNLSDLKCNDNLLTVLDLPDNDFNGLVQCNNNNLESIDFTGVSNIDIDCSFNNISSFIFPERAIISSIYAESNQILDLDLSNIDEMGVIFLYDNPVQTINIKNGVLDNFSGIHLDIYEESQLEFVCVDEEELLVVTDYFYQPFYSDVVVHPYCSYTPGGTYNTITGKMLLDSNNNGCDMADMRMPNAVVKVNDGINNASVFVSVSGNYFYYNLEGTFIITPIFENIEWFTISPSSATVTFTNDNDNIEIQNFCITANGIHNDLEIVIVPIIAAQPGFDASYQIVYKNKGNQVLSGSIDFSYNDSLLDLISTSAVPDIQTPGNLSWNYADLNPFESRTIDVVFNVNSPMETPAVNIDDVLDFTADINPISGDETPTNNNFALEQIVRGSYDPNDIACLEGDTVASEKIGEYLHYNIRFENTGTAPTSFVVVKDIIDDTKFDLSSFQVMHSSHDMATRITNSTVEFLFETLSLGPNEMGNIVFKIKTLDTLSVGDSVAQQAEIFFDYNFPIETNIAETSFQVLSIDDNHLDDSFAVYPNPSKGEVAVEASTMIKSIELYDVQGRQISTYNASDFIHLLDLSNYRSGMYVLEITTISNTKHIERLIKE